MSRLVLTDEQVQVIFSVARPMQACDGKGNVIGFLSPLWTEDDLIEAERIMAAGGPRYTTEQVLAHLKSLKRP